MLYNWYNIIVIFIDWYEGEKLSDGNQGWFPSTHVEEIPDQHVKARSLRIRYLSEHSILGTDTST